MPAAVVIQNRPAGLRARRRDRLLEALLVAATLPTAVAAPFSEHALSTAAALRDAAASGSGAFAIVESLSTEIGPRMAGTEADARAVDWARARFEAAGFDRVWLEPVRFPNWRRGHERAEVLAPYAQPLQVTALGGSVGTGGTLEAVLVGFAGLGGPGPDLIPLKDAGMPWAQLAQDGSDCFDLHHTADDTLDKIDPTALDQQVATYAAFAWLAAEAEGDFGRLPVKQ